MASYSQVHAVLKSANIRIMMEEDCVLDTILVLNCFVIPYQASDLDSYKGK